ncbi:MAG: family 16 glycosylhydrolase [Acidobacteria bacterium]|nr:family 16 glycosylhydrolase [Acidobacteriota bacterium]
MIVKCLLLAWLIVPSVGWAQTFSDDFSAPADRLDRSIWTTEIGAGSFLGRTQLRDWVTEGGVGRFVVADGSARLALDTFNPTGLSLYGTHAKTRVLFQPSPTTDVVLAFRMRLTSLQRGLVYGLYFYGCGASCSTDHDEVDIEVVSNYLQAGVSPLRVQLNRYAAEPLGAGHGPVVDLPPGFDPLAYHEWKIRWGTSRLTYYVDAVALFSTTTFVPQRPMHADMIVWGPASSDWSDAYDPSLQAVDNAGANQAFVALIDRFTVRTLSVFEDSLLTPGSTVIRLAHMMQLRDHIDAVRTREGLPAFLWADPNPAANSTVVQARHIVDLRTALADVYVARGLLPPVYTDGTLSAGVVIKATHINELRATVMAVE